MRKTHLSFALVVILIAILVASCSSNPPATTTTSTTQPSQTSVTTTKAPTTTSAAATTTTKTPKTGGTLQIITGVLPDGIFGYPPDVVNGASVRIAGHVMEGLFKMNADGTLTPVLATSWTIADDKKSITFILRKGVKFMDGSDFNAQAVQWNFQNQITAKKVAAWASVDVIDDYTVKVNFTSAANTNLKTFADVSGFIVSPTGFQTHGKQWMYLNIDSTAAFSISDFSRDVSVTMVKNPNYWKKGQPYLDGIKYTFIPDSQTAWPQFQTGKADVWWTNAQYISQGVALGYPYVAKAGTVMSMVPDSANTDSPWSKLKVRQAAEYAIDREAMAKAFGFGLTKAPYQLAMDDPVASIPNLQARKYDPNMAKQLLTEAGYPNGFETQLICQVSSITNRDEVQAIKAYLEAVGIKAQVNYYETAKYYEYRNGTWKNGLVVEPIANGNYGNYNATLNNYFGRTAVTFLSLGKSDAFLSALDTSMASAYPESALEQAACKALFDDAMVIPFSQRITFWMLQPNNKIQDLGLETRHYDLFFNTEDAWFDK